MALAPADWRPVCVCGAWCVRSRNIVSVPNGLAGRTHWRMGLQRNSRVEKQQQQQQILRLQEPNRSVHKRTKQKKNKYKLTSTNWNEH